MKRRRQEHEDGPDGNPESSSRRDVDTEDRSDAGVNKDDPILQPNHKIFLSHSGYQKDFVEELCGDLEKQYRFPFFDRRSSSLPKGERFPELILRAAEQCELAVVVLSEEFLTSKWPMIELSTFVQTRLRQEELKSSTKLKILPLFFGLSAADLRDKDRRAIWFYRWDELAEEDRRIDVEAWKRSLKVLDSFNGIPFTQEQGAQKGYREKVVGHICEEVRSDVKRDDSHVKGGSRLCQVIQDYIKHIQISKQFKKICIVGVYGVGGIGKTTACKVLCNDYFQEFKGKASHVDLGLESMSGLLKKILRDLIGANQEFHQQLDDDECWNILCTKMCKEKVFLAIDNVWPTSKSIEVAQKYLQLGFHKESVVMVTSRALETLTYLGLSESECLEMPSLGREDATSLFLHHAAFGVQFLEDDDKRAIGDCVARCYFNKGNREGGHYLPLALKALGVQLGCVGKRPSEWVRALPKVRDFNYLGEKENPVFSILGSSFDSLQPIYQRLFMDVVLYHPPYERDTCMSIWIDSPREDKGQWKFGVMEWLSVVYNKDAEGVGIMLQHLQGRGLLEDVDMVSQRVQIHDLYREFAKLEAQGKVNESADFEKRRWVWYEFGDDFSELEKEPQYRCWANLIRIGIRCKFLIGNLYGIEWKYFSNVEVLNLSYLENLRGELNVKGLKCLRSLEILKCKRLDRVAGLQDLNKLVYFIRRESSELNLTTRIMGQLPASLRVLELKGVRILFTPDVFTRCTKLTKLRITSCCVKNLDFSACASLQTVELVYLERLQGVVGPRGDAISKLQSLIVYKCPNLVEIPGVGQNFGLQQLHLTLSHTMRKLPGLQKLTRLQALSISEVNLDEVPGLSLLRQLRELRWTDNLSTSMKVSSLSGFEELETVDLSGNMWLKSLEGVFGDLPALRRLNLGYCRSLCRMPDLSRARKLEELDLVGSGVEVGEEELGMLAALSRLHCVRVGAFYRDIQDGVYRLDVVRRKVQYESGTELSEWDLRFLPVIAKDIRKSGKVKSPVVTYTWLVRRQRSTRLRWQVTPVFPLDNSKQ